MVDGFFILSYKIPLLFEIYYYICILNPNLNSHPMATLLKRDYTGKDVDMLTACATIIEQAIIHKTFLVSKRANWADPFFPNLKIRIANAFTNYLGIDNAKEMRDATQVVLGIQKNAMRDTAEFKVQIMEDFKNDKPQQRQYDYCLFYSAGKQCSVCHL